MREGYEIEDEDDWFEDPHVERAARTAKQLQKIDNLKLMPAPHDLAKSYLTALTDEAKKKELLNAAFGENGVLGKYKKAPRTVSVALRGEEDPLGIALEEEDADADEEEDNDSEISDSDAEDKGDSGDALLVD